MFAFDPKWTLPALGESSFPVLVADVARNTDLQNNRFSPADSALGELANEVHQNTTNCCASISAGGNEFGRASKRNNAQTVWRQPDCGSSGHDPAGRHDGCTKSHADEGALSQALSAARASRPSHWYAGARSLRQDAGLRSQGGTHSCGRD